MQRFLEAALELMVSRPDKEFTVQEVIDQSGQSLRSFYQHFTGKHELLLALLEETVRLTADRLQALIAEKRDPVERLRLLVVEYYRVCRPVPSEKGGNAFTPAMAEFAQQLLTTQPHDATRAFVPIVALFERTLADAAATGGVRDDVAVTGVLLQAIMFNAFATTISRSKVRTTDDAADQLWDLIFHGITS